MNSLLASRKRAIVSKPYRTGRLAKVHEIEKAQKVLFCQSMLDYDCTS